MSSAVFPGAAWAQSDSGEIRILVTDAASKLPIALARVLLDGPVITSELTSTTGEVHFTDVPDGIYRARVVKRGYSSLTSASFEVLGGRLITVTVALVEQTNGLKLIGSVSVKASATISSTSISENSPQRRLSDDLAGALNKLSGVSVSTSGDDSDQTQTISLEGHDPSQTQLTLDGIPLNAPGSAGNLGAFATDLFGGASVHQGQALGAAGGSVNFSTLQPTLSWLSSALVSTASYGKYNYSFAESGSVGKLGLAAQTVYRVSPSLVDWEPPYLDASGLFYDHEGGTSISGNLVKMRYQFGDAQTLTGTFLNSARDSSIVCLRTYAPPALPCGYGPNNSNDGNVQLYSLTDNALLGATEVQASVYSTSTASLLDQQNRFVAALSPAGYVYGVPAPTGFSTLNKTQGFTMNATLPAKEHHTFSIQAYGDAASLTTAPLVPQGAPYYSGAQDSSYYALQVSDAIHSSERLTLNLSGGISHASGSGGATAIASAAASWRPTNADAFSASFSVGGASPNAGRSQILTDPTSLRFDCNGDVAYGNAPGDEPGSNSSNSVRAGYTRTFRGGNVSLTLYHQVQNGVLLPVYVNGTQLTLPPGYLATAQTIYQSPGGCFAGPSAALKASQLYFTTPVSGIERIYEGGSLVGYATVGDLIIQPYYNVNVAKAIGNSALFANPYAITISGNQLPNVPLQKAGIVFDYKAPHSILEWLADAQYVAGNNPNNLPAYTTFDAGVAATLARGTLTIAGSNLSNAYAGIFAGPQNAVPYTTLGGYTVGTTARPLTPRSVSATYTVKFGPGAAAAGTGPAFRLPRGAGGGAPGEPGGAPEGRGPGRFFSPLPTSPPAQPFALDAAAPACTAASAAQAKQLATELDTVRAAVEAAKTPAGYPATFTPPALDDAVVTYHGLGDTYALTITPRVSGGLRSIAACLPVHIARADDVTARKLYTSNSTLFIVPQLTFMPSVGLYFVARRQQAGQEQFRVYKLPATAPADPFGVRASAACTGDAKNTAAQALQELHDYFAAQKKPASWTVTAHPARGGTWYELEPGDPMVIAAIVTCGRVAAAAPDELAQRGYDGKPLPELNYAPALGLYLIRPQRPPGAPGGPGP